MTPAGLWLPPWLPRSRPQSWHCSNGSTLCSRKSCGAAGAWGEERATEAGSLEARLRESEQARALLEREAEEARRQLAALGQNEPLPAEAPWARRPLDPRRRSLPAGDALYLSFNPPQVRLPGAVE